MAFSNYSTFMVAKMPRESVAAPVKIAAFDLDWTLIKTQSGSTFPKDKNDWAFLFDDLTKKKLTDLSH